jgi:hypothetical protein
VQVVGDRKLLVERVILGVARARRVFVLYEGRGVALRDALGDVGRHQDERLFHRDEPEGSGTELLLQVGVDPDRLDPAIADEMVANVGICRGCDPVLLRQLADLRPQGAARFLGLALFVQLAVLRDLSRRAASIAAARSRSAGSGPERFCFCSRRFASSASFACFLLARPAFSN